MSEKVYVTLPRTVSYREEESAPELAYGPGRAQVPLPLAESLKEWGIISEWSETAPTTPDTDPIKPSDELATDFPGREYLYMNGYTSYGQVAELNKDDLIALPGIGEATADKILAAMATAEKRMPHGAQPDAG
jgi:hypothetical protein